MINSRSIRVTRSNRPYWNSNSWDKKQKSFDGTYSGRDAAVRVYWEPYRIERFADTKTGIHHDIERGGFISYSVTLNGMKYYMSEHGERTEKSIVRMASRFLKAIVSVQNTLINAAPGAHLDHMEGIIETVEYGRKTHDHL